MKNALAYLLCLVSALFSGKAQDFDGRFYNIVWEKSLTPEIGVPDEYYGSRMYFSCMDCLDINNCIVMGAVDNYPNIQFPPEPRSQRLTVRTTDGGQTWKTGRLSPDLEGRYGADEGVARMRSVVMLNKLIAVAAGDSGILVRTSDGGLTWERIRNAAPQQTGAGFRSVAFTLDRSTGMAVGTYGIISITTDSGVTWNTKELWVYPTIFNTVVSPSNEVFYVFDEFYGKMFRTFDAGKTWDTLTVYKHQLRSSVPITADSMNQGGIVTAYFDTPANGWLSSVEKHKENTPEDQYKVISRTTDSGKTWVMQRSDFASFQDYYNSISFADAVTGMIGCYEGSALFCTNGYYWRETSPIYSENNPAVRFVQYKEIHAGFAFLADGGMGRSYGSIYRFRRVPITGVEEINEWGSNPYFWVQTAPNPAVSTVRARLFGLYSIKTREVTAKVYDMMGNVVYDASRAATDGNNGAWSDLTFSVEGWTPGVYLLGMQAEGAGFARAFVVGR